MKNTLQQIFSKRTMSLIAFASLCIVGSFVTGIRTAGDVHPFGHIEAEQADLLRSSVIAGDIDGNGSIELADAQLLLNILNGSHPLTSQALKADLDGDGKLTINDLSILLRILSQR
jgi:hypothetical protein